MNWALHIEQCEVDLWYKLAIHIELCKVNFLQELAVHNVQTLAYLYYEISTNHRTMLGTFHLENEHDKVNRVTHIYDKNLALNNEQCKTILW